MKNPCFFMLTRTLLPFAAEASAQQPSILQERTITPSTRTVLSANFDGSFKTLASETFSAFPIGSPRLRYPSDGIAAVLSASVGPACLSVHRVLC